MKNKASKETFMECPDPSICAHLKQGDKVRVVKTFKGQPIEVDFIVKYNLPEDNLNGNFMVEVFTQQLNKMLGKPKSYILNEKLVMNTENIGNFKFCHMGYKRWNQSRVRRPSTLS
jgi:hypothetical protein